MEFIIYPLVLLACSLAFLFRGGGIAETGSTFLARLVWCATYAAAVMLVLDVPLWAYFAAIPLAYLGVAFVGWHEYYDIGKRDGTWGYDIRIMTMRGLIMTFLPALAFVGALTAIQFALLAGSGLFMGLIYGAARWTRLGRVKAKPIIMNDTQAAEFVTGLVVGLSILIAGAL